MGRSYTAIVVASMLAFGGVPSVHAAAQDVELRENRVFKFVSMPVETENGRVVGQLDVILKTGKNLEVVSYRPAEKMTRSDGRLTIRTFGTDRRQGGVTALQDDEPHVIGYGSTLVTRSGGVCIIAVYEELSDGNIRTIELVRLPCESETDPTP